MATMRLAVVGAVAAVAATVFMARKDPTDHYAALGVDRRAPKDEIRAAYKQAALKFHPDKLSLIHISSPRDRTRSRMPSSA